MCFVRVMRRMSDVYARARTMSMGTRDVSGLVRSDVREMLIIAVNRRDRILESRFSSVRLRIGLRVLLYVTKIVYISITYMCIVYLLQFRTFECHILNVIHASHANEKPPSSAKPNQNQSSSEQ